MSGTVIVVGIFLGVAALIVVGLFCWIVWAVGQING